MTYNFDVDSIKARLIQRLQSKSSWAQVLPFSTNARLIDAIAEEMADLALYDESLTMENKWSLAQNISSLTSFYEILRYQAHRAIGSIGFIRVAIDSSITSGVWNQYTTYAKDTTIYYNAPLWSAVTTYAVNTIVYYIPIGSNQITIYKSLQGSNTNNQPDISSLFWQSLGIASSSQALLYKSLQNSNTNHQPDLAPTYWDLIDISPANNIGIPQWTVFTDQSGTYNFTNFFPQTLTTGANFVDVSVIQGTPKSFTVYAQGILNEEIRILDSTIESYNFILYVNGVEWTNVDNVLNYGSSSLVYEIQNLVDFSGIILKFGDGVYGKKLSSGDQVIFNYISTLGASGNITANNIITKVSSTLYDTLGNKVTAYCTNLATLLGGDDIESKESIRLNAPKTFQAGDRASTISDYEAIILNNFSFVKKIAVWGAYEYNIDNGLPPWTYVPLQENVVNVAGIDVSGSSLTVSEQTLISQGINAYKSPTDVVIYQSVRFINLVFDTVAYVTDTSYTLTQVVNNILAALSSNYSWQDLNLKQSIHFSDYQRVIDQVSGVDYHDTAVQLYYNFLFSTNAYLCQSSLPSASILPGSISVYVQDTTSSSTAPYVLIATDTGGLGVFVAQPGYTLSGVTNSVTYGNGAFGFAISSGLSNPYQNYNVRIFYKLSGSNLLLQQRYDIFNFDPLNSNITAQYESI